MRTSTFYSYKGGTGRTLLLANVAILAARMGWKVVAVDVDLEAPGLAYKLLDEPAAGCDGLVGWLRDRFASGKPPLAIADSLVDVPVADPLVDGGWLRLMPAGRNPSLNYFRSLTGLRLEERIGDGEGVDAFLDLKRQIAEDLGPDLLLLDARTGIGATNLVTTRVLADDVVALALDSREQLDGTRSVLRSLTPLTSLQSGEPLRLHVVLARVAGRAADVGSYAVTDAEREQIDRVRRYLREPADPLRATLTIEHVHLLHSEPSLVRGDFLTLARTRVLDATALHVDCIRIAEAVLGDGVGEIAARVIATTEDPARRESLAEFFVRPGDITAARGASRQTDAPASSRSSPDLAERVALAESAAQRDPTRRPDLARALLELARGHSEVGRRADAVAPTERAVEIYEALAAENPAFLNDLASSLNNLGIRYSEVGRRADAIEPTQRAVKIYEALAAENPAFLNDLASVAEQPRHPLQRGRAPRRRHRTNPTRRQDLRGAGGREPRVSQRPRHVAEQPRHPLQRGRAPRRRHRTNPTRRQDPRGAGGREPRISQRPRQRAEQPRHPLQRGRAPRRRRRTNPTRRQDLRGAGGREPRVSQRPSPCR